VKLHSLSGGWLLVLAAVVCLTLILFFYSHGVYIGWLIKLVVFGWLLAVLVWREWRGH